MINFQFLKVQIKSNILITLIISLIVILISIFSMSFVSYTWSWYVNGIFAKNGALEVLGGGREC